MSKEKSFKNKHYLGVVIERDLWNQLRVKASKTQDSVGKIVRNALINLVENDCDKIK